MGLGIRKFLHTQSLFKKIVFQLLILFLLLFIFQFYYFLRIYSGLTFRPSEGFDLVLTYSDESSMEAALDLALSRKKPLYVSQALWEPNPFRKHPASDLTKVHLDPTASTTDQNARRAAAFIRQGGYKRVALDVGWFHVPRALFLTRLYLLGSGVQVIPCSKTPLPEHWWAKRLFRMELLKFWGSLGRVALAFFGWETGPSGPIQ